MGAGLILVVKSLLCRKVGDEQGPMGGRNCGSAPWSLAKKAVVINVRAYFKYKLILLLLSVFCPVIEGSLPSW